MKKNDVLTLHETIESIKKMNKDIEDILAEFTKKTGLHVANIYLDKRYIHGDVKVLYDVDVVVMFGGDK